MKTPRLLDSDEIIIIIVVYDFIHIHHHRQQQQMHAAFMEYIPGVVVWKKKKKGPIIDQLTCYKYRGDVLITTYFPTAYNIYHN